MYDSNRNIEKTNYTVIPFEIWTTIFHYRNNYNYRFVSKYFYKVAKEVRNNRNLVKYLNDLKDLKSFVSNYLRVKYGDKDFDAGYEDYESFIGNFNKYRLKYNSIFINLIEAPNHIKNSKRYKKKLNKFFNISDQNRFTTVHNNNKVVQFGVKIEARETLLKAGLHIGDDSVLIDFALFFVIVGIILTIDKDTAFKFFFLIIFTAIFCFFEIKKSSYNKQICTGLKDINLLKGPCDNNIMVKRSYPMSQNIERCFNLTSLLFLQLKRSKNLVPQNLYNEIKDIILLILFAPDKFVKDMVSILDKYKDKIDDENIKGLLIKLRNFDLKDQKLYDDLMNYLKKHHDKAKASQYNNDFSSSISLRN